MVIPPCLCASHVLAMPHRGLGRFAGARQIAVGELLEAKDQLMLRAAGAALLPNQHASAADVVAAR